MNNQKQYHQQELGIVSEYTLIGRGSVNINDCEKCSSVHPIISPKNCFGPAHLNEVEMPYPGVILTFLSDYMACQ